jgi:hypothetical protein
LSSHLRENDLTIVLYSFRSHILNPVRHGIHILDLSHYTYTFTHITLCPTPVVPHKAGYRRTAFTPRLQREFRARLGAADLEAKAQRRLQRKQAAAARKVPHECISTLYALQLGQRRTVGCQSELASVLPTYMFLE